MLRALVVALALVAAACSSTSKVESRPVTDTGGADARRRAEVHTALAGEYYSRGNFSVALSETRLAIKDDPTYFNAHNMLGLVFMELREDGLARESFNRALQLAPNNPEVLNNYGWFLCLRNETERGLEMMQRAAGDTLYATPEKAWLSIGLCHRRANRPVEAEEALRRAQEELEARVRERTAQLARANESLREEMTERARIERARRELLGRLAFAQ